VRFSTVQKRMLTLIFGLALVAATGPYAIQKQTAPSSKPKTASKRQMTDAKSLDPIYQDFLKLVTYTISPKEKEVFLELMTNRDRDIFIEDFWKVRDPTPDTPENEYKEEITRRFNYVNKRFMAGRRGWMTDRGRIYMILGEPNSYDRYPGTSGIVPCEVWYYYTDGTKNLPTHFGLIFYQENGGGGYKLYDPFVDGPKSLIEPMASFRTLDPTDYETLHDTIQKLAPALADISISLVPGEFGYGFQPTSRSTELLADIFQSPFKDLNPTYATHFFDYKALVSTEYMTNYIESDGLVTVIRDPSLDLSFVHFSIFPQKLSLDFYAPKDQYYCNFKVDVSLRRSEKVVYQYSREFALYFPSSEIERVRQNGISLEDAFPVSEGQYKLTVLVQNSVAKEFTVFERPIIVPKAGGPPYLNGPILGYNVKTFQNDILIPFKTLERKLIIDPKMAFGTSDEIDVMFSVANLPEDLWQNGEVQLNIKGLSKTPLVKKHLMRLADSPYSKVLCLTETIAAEDYVPDYYELTLSLVGADGKVLDEKSTQFVISPDKVIAHPIAKAKGFSLSNRFLIYYQLARQNDKMNSSDQAEAYYTKGFSMNPGYKEGVSEYAHFLLKVHKFDEALTIVESLKGFEQGRYDYFQIKGLASMGKGDFSGAILNFLEANKVYNSDPVSLNALGACFLKTNQKEQALNAYKASLKVNDKQEDIKKIVEDLEKK